MLAAALAAIASTAIAQSTPLPLWEAGAFVGAISTPAYPASSDRSDRLLALPYIMYRGDVLRIDRSTVGARVVHSEDFELDDGFSAQLH